MYKMTLKIRCKYANGPFKSLKYVDEHWKLEHDLI